MNYQTGNHQTGNHQTGNHQTGNHQTGTLKQTFELELSASLVSRARSLNPDLNGTVEKLLARWVVEEDKRQIEQWIDASNAWVEKHGLPGAEFSPA